MGADFYCIALPIPKKDGKPIDLHYDAAIKAVNETKWEETDYYRDYYDGQDIGDVKYTLITAVEDLRDVITNDNSREVSIIDRPTELLIVTGGMSWGDSPTEFFDTLVTLESSGISDVLVTGVLNG